MESKHMIMKNTTPDAGTDVNYEELGRSLSQRTSLP